MHMASSATMSSLRQASAQAVQTPAKQAPMQGWRRCWGLLTDPIRARILYALDTAVDVLCIGDLVIALDHARRGRCTACGYCAPPVWSPTGGDVPNRGGSRTSECTDSRDDTSTIVRLMSNPALPSTSAAASAFARRRSRRPPGHDFEPQVGPGDDSTGLTHRCLCPAQTPSLS